MLEKIARENDIECPVLHGPGFGTILGEEFHAGREELGRVGVQVHPEFLLGLHLVDELSISTAKIKNGGIFWDQFLEKILDQDSPNRFAILKVRRETLGVNSLKVGISVGLVCFHR